MTDIDPSRLLTAEEASSLLGVRPASLYAYVSRGRIRALPHPDDPRARLYARADVEALIARKERQARPGSAAASALDWGLPVLASGLSSITDGRLAYRGQDAMVLAETATLETIAELLWATGPVAFRGRASRATPESGSPIDRAVLALAAELPEAMPGESGARLAERAARLVRIIGSAAAGRWLADAPLHEALAATWQAPAASEAIRKALVLVADHELNASTFAVRVAASTGASLTHALIAGLVTLAGPTHGGATDRVAAFLDEVQRAGNPEAAVGARLQRGESLPGFGHRLYPAGDPRAMALLDETGIGPADAALIEAVEAATAQRPTIDVALVLLERRFRLPPRSALALFATGRSVGWIAHALEQAATGQLIRPRAVFNG
ncbi:citrate synthase family protein [Mesorhizobium sp. BR1-1-16]|uniref:citrate synthase family protein n=1 Tax=Mesorhizobium sp. BR1-1-16 TaxID=2876653 RepID=UPI001CCF9544|nr:citrate synthase family protein [Mesorhizobium sp. BR1-1-16]MBZ9939461.1 citrate synthase family protein [Mesorhizobium sp. BR1-1-16]